MKKIKDKKKLRALLSQIDPDEVESVAVKNFEDDLSYIVKKLDSLKDSSSTISLLKSQFEEFELTILQKLSNLSPKSSVEEIRSKEVTLSNTISLLDDRIEEVDGSLHKEFNSFATEIRNLLKEFQDTNNLTKSEIDDIRIRSLGNRGGSIPLQVSAGGTVANTRYAEINFVGATATTNNTTKKTDITTGGSGSGFQRPLTGVCDGVNKTFNWTTAPSSLVSDEGRTFQKLQNDGITTNWTGTTTTVLTIAPNFDIFSVA